MLNDKTSPSSAAAAAAVRLLFGLQLSAYTKTCTRSGGHLTYVRQYSFLQPPADGKSLLIIWCTVPFSFQPPWHLYAANDQKRIVTMMIRRTRDDLCDFYTAAEGRTTGTPTTARRREYVRQRVYHYVVYVKSAVKMNIGLRSCHVFFSAVDRTRRRCSGRARNKNVRVLRVLVNENTIFSKSVFSREV